MGEAADTTRQHTRIVAAPVRTNRSPRRARAEIVRQRALTLRVRPRSFYGLRPRSYRSAVRSAPRAHRTARRTQRTSDGEPHPHAAGDR